MEKIFNKNKQTLPKCFEFLSITFKPTLAQRFSRITEHDTLALPFLLYGNEILTLRKKKYVKDN